MRIPDALPRCTRMPYDHCTNSGLSCTLQPRSHKSLPQALNTTSSTQASPAFVFNGAARRLMHIYAHRNCRIRTRCIGFVPRVRCHRNCSKNLHVESQCTRSVAVISAYSVRTPATSASRTTSDDTSVHSQLDSDPSKQLPPHSARRIANHLISLL